MKKLFFMLALLPVLGWCEELRISDLSGGMYSNSSSNKIPDNAAAYIQNFITDVDPIAIERNGFTRKESTILGNTKPVIGLWKFNDTSGNEWLIAFSSNSYYRSKTGTAFENFGPITTNSNVPDCAVNLGKIMCVNGTDPAWTFDGTATATVSGAPIGRMIEPWRNRFAIADISSNRSSIRFSEDGLATNWVIGSTATAPFSLTIAGSNDGKPIRCLHNGYNDYLVVMRLEDTWNIGGFDQSDVAVRQLTSEIGCLDDRTVQELDGSMYWLSNRGIEKRTGNTIQNISEPIKDVVDSIVASSLSGEKSNTQTSKTDFDAGTQATSGFAFTSAVAGDLTAGTTSWSYTTQTEWGNGTISGNDLFYDKYTNIGTIQTTFPETFAAYRDGSGGAGSQLHLWDANGSPTISIASQEITIRNNSYGYDGIKTFKPIQNFLFGSTVSVSIKNIDFDGVFEFILGTSSAGINIGINDQSLSFFFYSKELAADSFTFFYSTDGIRYVTPIQTYVADIQNTNFAVYLSTSAYLIQLGTRTLNGTHAFANASNGSGFYMYLLSVGAPGKTVTISNLNVYPQPFSFITNPIDSGLSNNNFQWDAFSADTSGNGSWSFQSSVSSDNVTWITTATVSNPSSPSTQRFRYHKIIATPAPGSIADTQTTNLNSFNVKGFSTGVFTSQTINLGGIPTAFRPVQIDEADMDNKVSYQFNASTSSISFNPSSWTSITNGAVPSNSVNQYIAFKASFTITNATNVATLHSFTTNWIDGSSNPLSSVVWDRRYVLSYSTNNAFPQKALVWQKNQSWTLFDGIFSGSYAKWNNKVYFGNSNSSGLVYQFDVGSNDDGASISSVIKSKSYDLNSPSRPKEFLRAFTSHLGDLTGSGSFDLSYSLDRDTHTYTLGSANLNESNGQTLIKFPFLTTNSIRGREIQYTLNKTGVANRLKLYDLITEYSVKEPD